MTNDIWELDQSFKMRFDWRTDIGRDPLVRLYEKGKEKQWNANKRIDWSLELDPENPQEISDRSIPIYGSDVFAKLTTKERISLRHHFQAWQLSQFLHGEQAALLGTAKIVQQIPSMDAKLFAATQVIDEARHVEAYTRLLRDKFKLTYDISPPLKHLLEGVLNDSRWDMTYLGIQVLI